MYNNLLKRNKGRDKNATWHADNEHTTPNIKVTHRYTAIPNECQYNV